MVVELHSGPDCGVRAYTELTGCRYLDSFTSFLRNKSTKHMYVEPIYESYGRTGELGLMTIESVHAMSKKLVDMYIYIEILETHQNDSTTT